MSQRIVFSIVLAGFASIASACSGDEAPITISVFTASASAVARGRPVTLAWSVQNADSITLLREPDTTLLADHGVLEGSHQTEPIERSTAFTLIAKRGDASISETLRVTALGTNERVSITRFEAEPTTVRPGQPVTLSWTTVAASGASITDLTGATIAAQAEIPSGTLQVTPTTNTTYILEALGPSGPARAQVEVVVRQPSIEIFAASPTSITVGETSELSWAVTQATTIEITDEADAVVYSGSDLFGSVDVTPNANATYTLTASDEGGASVTAMVSLTVTEPVQAEILSFTATPNATDIGEPAVLEWSVQNAPGGIAIEAGGNVLVRSAERTGTFSVVQAVSTTYTLTAFSSGGNATQSVAVASNPSPPAIVAFEATPASAVIGTNIALSWSTLGATSVEVLRGSAANGVLEYTATNDVAAGTVSVPISAASTMFTLRARNGNGDRTQSVTVSAFARPTIIGFTATPLSFSTTPADITLAWSTSNAQSVSLFVGGVPDTTFPATTIGTHTVQVSQTTLFEIVASNPAASVSRTVLVAETVGETEPNDTAATAFTGLMNGGNVPGSIATATDVDWYEITVPAGGGIVAETSDGAGSCTIDTILQLWREDAANTYTMLGENDEGGMNGCSRIDRAVDAYAADLTAGTYFVRVASESGPGDYTLSVAITGAACPNGIQEINNPMGAEECDDGNGVNTDACSNTCQRNITNIGTVSAISPHPASAASFTGAITPVGSERFVTLNLGGVANGAYVMARTYAATAPSCTEDTVLTLYDRYFRVLGQNDQSGVDDCSIIHPGSDGMLHAFADVPAGVYYLGVREFGDDAVIGQFTIQVRAESKNRCGNRVVEGTEECDDGNTVTTDACNACSFTGVLETEPNDDVAAADVATGERWMGGRIDTEGDVDWYRISIPNNHSLRAATSDGFGGCALETGGVPTRLTLYWEVASNPGVLTELGSVEQNVAGGCAQIDGLQDAWAQVLTSSRRYYLSVEAAGGGVGPYTLEVASIAPGCGNQIVESGEQCDDGNTTNADGCSSSCAFEIAATVTATGAASSTDVMTIPVGGFGVVRVQAANGTDVRVVTSDVGGASCTFDTVAALVDATGGLRGAEEDGVIAPGTCARIEPTTATYAANLAGPAEYFVLVFNQSLMSITAQVATTLLP